MDIGKFLDFKIRARYARTSILGFVEILRSQGDGFPEAGEECNDLGIQDANGDGQQNPQPTDQRPSNNSRNNNEAAAGSVVVEQQRDDDGGEPVSGPPLFSSSASEAHSFDLCPPFFHPALLDLFPDGEMPDLDQFETMMPSAPNMYDHHIHPEAWDMSGIAPLDT